MRGTRIFSAAIVLSALSMGCASTGHKKLSNSETAALWVQAAQSALYDGDLTGALQDLATAEKSDPKLADIYHVRALVFVAKKEYPKAMEAAKKALELAPKNPAIENTIGKLYLDQGQFAPAVPYLKDSANNELFAEAYKASTNLGILYYRQSKWDESKTWFTKAVNSSPLNSCIAHYYLGHLALRISKFKDAETQYELATQRFCASFAEARLALGIAFAHDGNYDRARKTFLEVQQRFPDTPVATQAIDRMRKLP